MNLTIASPMGEVEQSAGRLAALVDDDDRSVDDLRLFLQARRKYRGAPARAHALSRRLEAAERILRDGQETYQRAYRAENLAWIAYWVVTPVAMLTIAGALWLGSIETQAQIAVVAALPLAFAGLTYARLSRLTNLRVLCDGLLRMERDLVAAKEVMQANMRAQHHFERALEAAGERLREALSERFGV